MQEGPWEPLWKHPLQQQHCDHTEDCVQQELNDVSGHSAPVLSLKGLLPVPNSAQSSRYPCLPPDAQGNMEKLHLSSQKS
jgi:hypothetical protein